MSSERPTGTVTFLFTGIEGSTRERTVKAQVSQILSKLDLRDRAQAVVLAYRTGLARPGG